MLYLGGWSWSDEWDSNAQRGSTQTRTGGKSNGWKPMVTKSFPSLNLTLRCFYKHFWLMFQSLHIVVSWMPIRGMRDIWLSTDTNWYPESSSITHGYRTNNCRLVGACWRQTQAGLSCESSAILPHTSTARVSWLLSVSWVCQSYDFALGKCNAKLVLSKNPCHSTEKNMSSKTYKVRSRNPTIKTPKGFSLFNRFFALISWICRNQKPRKK